MGLTVGVDVGGTKIAAGVVDEKGEILERRRLDSPATNSEAIESTIAELVLDLKRDHDVEAVGVGAAGFVDVRRSTVLFAPNLAWRDEPLKAELERLTDLPVVVENDANAAAWGEFAFGGGKDVDDLLLVTVGTGVGGGLVLDGKLHRGAFGVACMGLAPNGWWFTLAMLPNALWGLAMPTLQSLMTRRVSESEQGQLQGANMSVASIAGVLSPLFFGAVYSVTVGPDAWVAYSGTSLLIAAVVLLCAALIGWTVAKRAGRAEQAAVVAPES